MQSNVCLLTPCSNITLLLLIYIFIDHRYWFEESLLGYSPSTMRSHPMSCFHRYRGLHTPDPEASTGIVTDFLTVFFGQYFAYSEQEAYQQARKWNPDGQGLYSLSISQFNAIFGSQDTCPSLGRDLYLELHLGRFGKVHCSFWYLVMR